MATFPLTIDAVLFIFIAGFVAALFVALQRQSPTVIVMPAENVPTEGLGCGTLLLIAALMLVLLLIMLP